jgi:myo-inositol-1(or 4)-monophosphatase
MVDFESRLKVAEMAARQAGEYQLQVLPLKHGIDKKGVVNLVTEVDRNSEKLIYEAISKTFPGDRFMAEEGTTTANDSDLIWIVDPLDGTTNYAHRMPHFCVSIAVVKDGIPQVGCIYNPNLTECFTTRKGHGAFLNGRPLKVSENKILTDSLLATGFPYDLRESKEDNIANFAMFYKRAQAVRRAGSAALDLAYVAGGRYDGFWEYKLAPWDIAAGILLVTEAGGKVSNFGGEAVNIFKGEVLASNGLIHGLMVDVLNKSKGLQENCDLHSLFGDI